jgi:hypothetical protein
MLSQGFAHAKGKIAIFGENEKNLYIPLTIEWPRGTIFLVADTA